MKMWKLTFVLICNLLYAHSSHIDMVNDEEFMNLIRTEKNVLVLFSKPNCEACDKYEAEINYVKDEIIESLSSWIIKLHRSELVRLYDPTREPALVFFRHGVPLLYDGPVNSDAILQTLMENKEPSVKELSDQTFEHLTQAASGATTGDWFVMFYNTECVDCQRLQARWESVGGKLKKRMNVARVNIGTTGKSTAVRFEVNQVPSFILFRLGKMYRYNIQKYDVSSFVGFVQEWYKNMKPETVPVPKSPFDNLTMMVAEYLKAQPWMWKLGSIMFGIGIFLSILVRIKLARSKEPKKAE